MHDALVAANTDEAHGDCPAGNGADTIHLTGDVRLAGELPVIETVITIEGEGFTIFGNNRFRIFDVQFGRLEINELTLSNGYLGERRDARGSAIRLRDGRACLGRKFDFFWQHCWGWRGHNYRRVECRAGHQPKHFYRQ